MNKKVKIEFTVVEIDDIEDFERQLGRFIVKIPHYFDYFEMPRVEVEDVKPTIQ